MEPFGLSVLYEDDCLMAADKPAGLHTAPLGKEGEQTLLGLVLSRYPEVSRLPGIKAIEPGLLHRLDLETSGVVLIARTEECFERLRRDFAAGNVTKEYAAVSAMSPEGRDAAAGTVLDVKSRFAPRGPGRKTVRVVPLSGRGGRPPRNAGAAVYETRVEVLGARGGFRLIRARLTRGFRHQVRAHLAFLGLPIAGDPLYGAPAPADAPPRMYLHARSVALRHPVTGEALTIESPLPPEFRAIFA